MNLPTSEIEQLELTIEDAHAKIAQSDALSRLVKNKDFQLIIDKGYLENEAIRLVHLKADYAMRAPEQQEFIVKCLDGIGTLRGYLHQVMRQGYGAKEALLEHEATREELLREELGEGELN